MAQLIDQSDLIQVYVENYGDKPVNFKYNSIPYIINPGERKPVPFNAMKQYLGDPNAFDVPGDVRKKFRTEEFERLRTKYGVYAHNQHDWETNKPKVAAFDLSGNRLITVVDDPTGEHLVPSDISVKEKNHLEKQVQDLQAMIGALQMQIAQQSNRDEALANVGANVAAQFKENPDVVSQPQIQPEFQLNANQAVAPVQMPTPPTPGQPTPGQPTPGQPGVPGQIPAPLPPQMPPWANPPQPTQFVPDGPPTQPETMTTGHVQPPDQWDDEELPPRIEVQMPAHLDPMNDPQVQILAQMQAAQQQQAQLLGENFDPTKHPGIVPDMPTGPAVSNPQIERLSE